MNRIFMCFYAAIFLTISEISAQNFWSNIRYFTPEEFYVNREIKAIDSTMVIFIDAVRHELQKTIKITSGVRSENYNKLIGGKEGSKHIYGKAIDIKATDAIYKADLIYAILQVSSETNFPIKVIIYKTHIHLSCEEIKTCIFVGKH